MPRGLLGHTSTPPLAPIRVERLIAAMSILSEQSVRSRILLLIVTLLPWRAICMLQTLFKYVVYQLIEKFRVVVDEEQSESRKEVCTGELIASNSSHSFCGGKTILLPELSVSSGSLIPFLPDEIIEGQVWHLLANPPSVPLLMNLRHLNASWRRFVGDTVEWKVLSMLWSPEQGYKGYILRNWVKGVTPDRRLSWELACYRVIETENRKEISGMAEAESRSWYVRERCGGPYISSRWQKEPPGEASGSTG